MTTELRDYQLDILHRLQDLWTRLQSVMVQMPTGTGKTHLMAAVIEEYQEKGVLVVAHRVELIDQISRTLDVFGVEHGIIDGRGTRGMDKAVIVASVQTLARRADSIQGPMPKKRGRPSAEDKRRALAAVDFSLVIIDEAHHALAATYRHLWDKWPDAKFLGLTATPCRLNGAAFTDLFDTLLQSWSILDFIRKGWLSDLDYVSVRMGSKMMKRIAGLDKRSIDGDFQTSQMALVLDTPESIEQLYQSYKEYVDGKKGIVYAINREHARHIANYYQEHGVNCCLIDSKTPGQERQQLVADYRSGKIDVLVNVEIFSAGFDCPEVEFIQLARPTLSLSLYMQQVGRGMRISEGKSAVTILDQVGSYLLFGLPTSERNWQGMFLGTESGKGSLQALKRTYQRRNETEKVLAGEQMFRIDSLMERESKRETKKQPKEVAKRAKPVIWNEYLDPKNVYHAIARRMVPMWDDHQRLMIEIPRQLDKVEFLSTLLDKDRTWAEKKTEDDKSRMLIVVDREHQMDILRQRLTRGMSIYDYEIFWGRASENDYKTCKLVLCEDNALRFNYNTLAKVFTPDLIVLWNGNSFDTAYYGSALGTWPKAKVIGLSAEPCDNWEMPKGAMLYEALVPFDDMSFIRHLPKRKEVKLVSAPYEGVTLMSMRNIKPKIDPRFYVTDELYDLLTAQASLIHVYRSYERFAKGRRGIIYAYGLSHAEYIQEHFVRNGIKAEVFRVIDEEKTRRQMFNFYRGDISVLVAAGNYDCGYPFPEIEFVQLAYPSQQLSSYLNMIESGRRVTTDFKEHERVEDSDNELVVIDNTLMSERFGHPEKARDWKVLFLEALEYDCRGEQRKQPKPAQAPKPRQAQKPKMVSIKKASRGKNNTHAVPAQMDRWTQRKLRLLGIEQ